MCFNPTEWGVVQGTVDTIHLSLCAWGGGGRGHMGMLVALVSVKSDVLMGQSEGKD